MQFVYSPLTWGFLLALVPLAIHLINMMRHNRVKWAAMDFLLASYKKHKQWIWLKQLFLLLARMVAILLVVAMLSKLVSRNQWNALLGGRTTHHFVLLDDSYSMSDRIGATRAFDVANQVINRIAAQAGQSDFEHKLTLIRYSAALASGENAADKIADFNAETIDANFDLRVEEKRRGYDVSELAVGPTAALQLAKQLIGETSQDHNVVHVVSDFRDTDWASPGEAKQSLVDLQLAGAELRLVSCVRQEQANLGIEAITPTSDTRAAGVPLFVNISVRNHGTQAAKRVQVKVKTTFYDVGKLNTASPEVNAGESEELPVVLIDEIPAGEVATQRLQVYFPAPGQHIVEATLPEDAVAADNRRYAVIDFPEGEPVLVIDGHEKGRNAYYLTSAFQPGARANTGVRPDIQPAEFLRDAVPQSLEKYRAIYLLDVPRLDPRATQNLEEYVRTGGGLGIFVGPNTNLAYYNASLYKNGQGLLPAPFDRAEELLPDPIENKPDVEAESHPLFQPLLSEQNPLIRLVTIESYLRVAATWIPGKDNSAQVIASLRNRAPLVIEQPFGKGHVLLFTTTAAPDWNSWANDPTFVVVALKMQSYLARSPDGDQSLQVGAPLDIVLEASNFKPDVKFVIPGAREGSRVSVERMATKEGENNELEASIGGFASAGETKRAGIYEAWPTTIQGDMSPRRYAFNVDPREGDLALVDSATMLTKLAPVKATFSHFDDDVADADATANNFSLPLMGLLIALLLIEQVLAYKASYHPLANTVRA